MATVARIAGLIRENKTEEAMALHLNEGYPLYREISTLVTRAVRNEEAEAQKGRLVVDASDRPTEVFRDRLRRCVRIELAKAILLGWSPYASGPRCLCPRP